MASRKWQVASRTVRQGLPALSFYLPFAICTLLLLSACSTPPGEIFDRADTVHRWPPPPDPARIAYIGQLHSSADLKAGRSGMQGLNEALFGKDAPHEMIRPMGICSDGTRVFIADTDAHVVHVMDLSTRKYEQWAPPKGARPLQQPVAVAYDAKAGGLFVADSQDGSVMRFDPKGKFLGTIGDNWLHRPCGLAVDAAHQRLLVVDSAAHQIVTLGFQGQRLERVGKRGGEPGEFNYPTNVAIDNEGRVYVGDSLNFRVQVFSSDLTFIRSIGKKGDLPGYFSQPKGLAVDPSGELYVVDSNFEAVQVFDKDGAILMSFGKEGHEPGEFWLPTGIYADGTGRIWVADSFNKRVQVFERLGDTANGK